MKLKHVTARINSKKVLDKPQSRLAHRVFKTANRNSVRHLQLVAIQFMGLIQRQKTRRLVQNHGQIRRNENSTKKSEKVVSPISHYKTFQRNNCTAAHSISPLSYIWFTKQDVIRVISILFTPRSFRSSKVFPTYPCLHK